MNRRAIGTWGEAQVAEYLRKRGYEILASSYHCVYGEIDLIVRKKKLLCFVEVKLRKSATFGSAAAFVDGRKQNKLRTTAQLYLARNESLLQPRFDVIEIYAPQGMDTQNPEICLIENAF